MNDIRHHYPQQAIRFTVLALFMLLATSGCDREPAEFQARPGEAVRTATAEASPETSRLRLPGTVRPVQRTQAAFLQPGYLATREVVRGEQVSRGQLLATLQNPSLSPAVDSARARVAELEEQLAQAERELTRAERLAGTNAISEDELDRVRSRRDSLVQSGKQARAGLEESLATFSDSVLRAPFDGQVMTIHAEPGDYIPAGQPVFSLAGDEKGLEMEIHLPGRTAAKLMIGQVMIIEAADGLQTGTAVLREIGLAEQGRPAPAILALEEGSGWRSGQPVHAMVDFAEASGLLVPLPALSSSGNGQAMVFVVDSDTATSVPVTTGRLFGNRVEILARDQETRSIEAGDQVIIAGQERLSDGALVRVLP